MNVIRGINDIADVLFTLIAMLLPILYYRELIEFEWVVLFMLSVIILKLTKTKPMAKTNE